MARAADKMAPPVPSLLTTQTSAVDLTDMKVSDDKGENMEVDTVQDTLNAMAAQTTPMEEDVITIDDSSDRFVDTASATHDGKQNLLGQVKHNKEAKANADAKAKAAKAEADKADAMSQKSDSSGDTETPDIHVKVHRMTEDELPTIPVHQLGKYAISHIPKPGDPFLRNRIWTMTRLSICMNSG